MQQGMHSDKFRMWYLGLIFRPLLVLLLYGWLTVSMTGKSIGHVLDLVRSRAN